jgi:hypothetical protein
MVTVSYGKPTAERKREHARAHAVGQAMFGGHGATPDGTDKPLKYTNNKRWDETAKRWRYKPGVKSAGTILAGRFCGKPGSEGKPTKSKKRRRKYK